MKVHIAHILVDHAYEAEDIHKKLESGESFEALASKFSKCSSAASGGNLGQISLSRLDGTFAEAVEMLKPGAISGVVRTRFGHHIIWRKD